MLRHRRTYEGRAREKRSGWKHIHSLTADGAKHNAAVTPETKQLSVSERCLNDFIAIQIFVFAVHSVHHSPKYLNIYT